MGLLHIIIVLFGFLLTYMVIIKDVKNGKYILSEEKSILAEESERKYLKEFPHYTIEDLKIEISKIADMLIDNQESNRYTELLRQRANKDQQIQILKEAVVDKVDLIKYNDGDLKARIKYKDNKFEYSLIFDMNTVARGRVFLNRYFIFKSNLINAQMY